MIQFQLGIGISWIHFVKNYNGVVITDAIKFVQTNKEKLTMSTKEEDNSSKESKEPDYDEDKDQLEEKQEEETGELNQTTNLVF
jgi:hypothetical protein